MTDSYYAKIHVWSFGLAWAVVWSISLLIVGLAAMITGWGQGFVDTMNTIYIGYSSTLVGSFIGAIWAFIDAFVGFVVIASLYNFFLRCCSKKVCTTTPSRSTPRTRKAKDVEKPEEIE